MVRKHKRGIYKIINPDKYKGDITEIRYGSSQELSFQQFLDNNPNVFEWALEQTQISLLESKSKRHTNPPDYWIKYVTTHGELIEEVVEINKLNKLIRPPTNTSKPKKSQYKQGLYKLRYPDKYKGNINKVRYMSSWELNFHQFLDNNPNILEWSSEEIQIPYLKPTTGRVHTYLPDYWIKYTNAHGELIEEIIEVKPDKQTRAPTTVGKNKKTQLYEQISWAINDAKWKAAALFCKQKGIKFRIVTEKHIFK